MSCMTSSEITVNGIDYDVEHCEEAGFERIIIWTLEEKLVGDALVNHNDEQVAVHLYDGTEKRTESYDYWEFANTEDKVVAVNELALWMGAVA